MTSQSQAGDKNKDRFPLQLLLPQLDISSMDLLQLRNAKAIDYVHRADMLKMIRTAVCAHYQ